MEQGGGEAVQGLCGDFGDRGDASRQLPLPLFRDLAWFSPCLAAPGGSGQSLLAPGKSVLGTVAGGGRQQDVCEGPGQSRVPWVQICLFWVFLPTPCHPGTEGAQGSSSHSHPASSHMAMGDAAGWEAAPCSLPRPSCLQ